MVHYLSQVCEEPQAMRVFSGVFLREIRILPEEAKSDRGK